MGAGANVIACIYMPTKPSGDGFTVDFTTNGDACMNDSGSPASVLVNQQGITQVAVGYVESKMSGCKCCTAESLWTLAYNAPNTPYSGSIQTRWYCPAAYNEISLLNGANGICVNTQAALTDAKSQQWHGTGTLYIIFNPVSTAMAQHLPMLWYMTPEENHHMVESIFQPLVGDDIIARSKPSCADSDKSK